MRIIKTFAVLKFFSFFHAIHSNCPGLLNYNITSAAIDELMKTPLDDCYATDSTESMYKSN